MADHITYNNPKGGSPSEVGTQIRTDYYQKKALIEIKKEQYFGSLADVESMPKNMGKTIKRFHYMPLLDDRNINDQGIDAAGVVITTTQRFVSFPSLTLAVANAGKAAAAAAINDNINNNGSAETVATAGADGSGGSGLATITLTKNNIKYLNSTKSAAVVALEVGAEVTLGSGALYGSSKDIGTLVGKMPVLSESGGRVNRVGFKRIELEGTIAKYGFFDEYTQESMDFDTDEELEMHINREMLRGANEITEDLLQIDLLNAAGVVRFGGSATTKATVSGETGSVSLIDYADLMRLSIDLDNNRCPKSTKVITGSRMVDTKTLPSARVLYIGSELIPLVKAMKDLFNNQAFIGVEKYASAGDTLTGEIGQIDQFKIVVVPEMLHWAGAGAQVGASNAGYRSTGDKYDVFPMLCVGSGSFTTIGFQTDGKSVKFKIVHKKPGEAMVTTADPFGETGLMSIKWYYGFMALRPEWIAVCNTVAEV
jgi:N4-gp56 family major capsid protein